MPQVPASLPRPDLFSHSSSVAGARPRSSVPVPAHGAGAISPPRQCLLFMERFDIKCFSFRIGSFNMFYRKSFYVPIKHER